MQTSSSAYDALAIDLATSQDSLPSLKVIQDLATSAAPTQPTQTPTVAAEQALDDGGTLDAPVPTQATAPFVSKNDDASSEDVIFVGTRASSAASVSETTYDSELSGNTCYRETTVTTSAQASRAGPKETTKTCASCYWRCMVAAVSRTMPK